MFYVAAAQANLGLIWLSHPGPMQVTAGNMQIESTSGKEPVEPPPAASTLLQERGTYWGIWNTGANVGGFLTPLLVGEGPACGGLYRGGGLYQERPPEGQCWWVPLAPLLVDVAYPYFEV